MAVPNDNPIRHSSEDSLHRSALAVNFSRQVMALDASEGLVVGVLGPWGSGKTSFLNLAREDFESADAKVLDFNPWMFSGTEQLVEAFFTELSAQLRLKAGLRDVAERLADYGEAFDGLGWLPITGSWIERGRGGAKALKKVMERRREGSTGRREKVTAALSDLRNPIVVVLDDIDRLTTDEIRDIFKLVRLTASFPNIIYVVAFDRARVEKALEDEGVPGRDYLEKILQVAVDLPSVSPEVLDQQVFDALNEVLAAVEPPVDVDQQAWPDIWVEVVRPLIRNMRDVRRLAAAVQGTLGTLGTQVATADLIALEAIRVFLPDVFGRIRTSVGGLCTPSSGVWGAGSESPEHKEEIERLLGAAEDDRERKVVNSMIRRLFPFAGRHIGETNYGPDFQPGFLRRRRVAAESILRVYLEHVAGETLRNFYDAERAWEVLDDRHALDGLLRGLPVDRQEDVVRALQTWQDDFRPEQVVPATIVLENLLFDLPEKPRGFFGDEPRFAVGRVVYRLLRSLPDEVAVEGAALEILPELTSLSARLELLTKIGYRENAGHKLVTEQAATRLNRGWRDELRVASADELSREPELLTVFLEANRDLQEDERPVPVPDGPSVTLALLRSSKTESASQYLGTRSVSRETRLFWDTLVGVVGDEVLLRARLDELRPDLSGDDADLLALADRYLDGWRPE
jgi:KAP family P-loop domain